MGSRVRTSPVAWDAELQRVEYLGDDGVPISCEIVPRGDDDARSRAKPRVRASEIATVVQMPQRALSSSDEVVLEHARRFLLELADKAQPPYLIVDLSRMESFGAAFLNVLVRVWQRLREREGQLAVCGLRPRCAELVCLFRLDRLFPLYPTPQAALREAAHRAEGA
ncbi:MAG: STAS domain-containing protein [Planctomycetes bacterium]|nr:STAS domain-containing protein [Planctomycetota bacterium]